MKIQFVKPINTVPLQRLPTDFNWKTYVDLNDDVREIYNSEEAATQHYLHEGHKQNRRYAVKNTPSDFNWIVYLALNSDVYNVCKTRGTAIMHFEFHGFNEDRIYTLHQADIPDDFEWDAYRDLNQQFKRFLNCEIDAISHYYTYGKLNDLPYQYTYNNVPSDFDWKIYLELNDDVNAVCSTATQAKRHYENDGYQQNRRYNIPTDAIPDDFDWKMYIEFNPDIKLQYNSETLSKLHYYITGKNDNRIYKLQHTPPDFDWVMYLELNDTIPDQYKITELTAKLHYEVFGKEQGLSYIEDFTSVPLDFDWKGYIELNPDIADICSSELRAKIHYERNGFYQSRKYFMSVEERLQIEAKINDKQAIYEKHPFLFHKFLLGVSKPDAKIDYDVITPTVTCNPGDHNIVAHLHCYNIDRFEHFYSKYINVIRLHCSIVVVTFCIGNKLNLPKYDNMVVIHVPNVGMDIGGKYVCLDYLKRMNVDYKNVLFLHSKQDDVMRKSYWEPLLMNMAQIIRIMQTDNNIGIFVPPLIFMGDYANIIYKEHFIDPKNVTCQWNLGNSLYVNDLDRYYGFQKKNYLFPEGNCFLCNRSIAEMLYGDTSMYNLLNTNTSFDAVWVKSYYGGRMLKDVGNNMQDVYRFFRSHRGRDRIYPNNIAWGVGHKGHADNMIEHSYERMVFKVVQKLGYQVKIMPWVTKSDYLATLDRFNYDVNVMLRNNDSSLNRLKDAT